MSADPRIVALLEVCQADEVASVRAALLLAEYKRRGIRIAAALAHDEHERQLELMKLREWLTTQLCDLVNPFDGKPANTPPATSPATDTTTTN